MNVWRIRKLASREAISEWPDKIVRQMLLSRVLGDEHQYLPPGEVKWLSEQEAVRWLSRSSTTPVLREQLSADEGWTHEAASETCEADEGDSRHPTPKATIRKAATSNAATPKPTNRQRTIGAIDPEDDELEMTPMIDMTFLLLIFFMVTSSVTPLANLQLPPSRTGRAEETDKRVVLVVDFPEALTRAEGKSLTGSKFTTLANTRLYFQDDPQRVFAATEVDTELQRAFAAKPESRFILQANRKMPVGVVRQLLKSASAAGAKETLVGVTMPR